MDLLAILNLEDAPPYGRPSTPSVASSSSVGTPPRYSPSISFDSHSECSGRHKSLEDLRTRTRTLNSTRNEWLPPHFTTLNSPRDSEFQESSVSCTPLGSEYYKGGDRNSRRAVVTQYCGIRESQQARESQNPCVESNSPSTGVFHAPLRLSHRLQSPFRSLTSSQRSLRSQVGGCSSESISLYHTAFPKKPNTMNSCPMSVESSAKLLPSIAEQCKFRFSTKAKLGRHPLAVFF